MSFFSKFSNDPHLAQVMQAFPKGQKELLEFHDVVLRGESELTIGERELIACFVSRLNGCRFCSNSHRVYAAYYGVDPDIFDRLMDDIDTAGADAKLIPILHYVKKVTLAHGAIAKDDIDACLDAGWSDQGIYDAASTAALFNYMNRMVHATLVGAHDAEYDKRLAAVIKMPLKARLANNEKDVGATTYSDFGRAMKLF